MAASTAEEAVTMAASTADKSVAESATPDDAATSNYRRDQGKQKYVEYSMACATSASGVYNLDGGVRDVRKSGMRISPLPKDHRIRIAPISLIAFRLH